MTVTGGSQEFGRQRDFVCDGGKDYNDGGCGGVRWDMWHKFQGFRG